jgi:hypothetical protein
VLRDAMLEFARRAIPHATDSPQDANALVNALARNSRCFLRPLTVTVPRLASSTPAVLMTISAGRIVDVLNIFTLRVDAAQSAMRASQLRLIRE